MTRLGKRKENPSQEAGRQQCYAHLACLLRAPRVLQELVIQVCHLPAGERNFTFISAYFLHENLYYLRTVEVFLSHFKLNVLLISIFTFKKIFPNLFLNLVLKPEMAIHLKSTPTSVAILRTFYWMEACVFCVLWSLKPDPECLHSEQK